MVCETGAVRLTYHHIKLGYYSETEHLCQRLVHLINLYCATHTNPSVELMRAGRVMLVHIEINPQDVAPGIFRENLLQQGLSDTTATIRAQHRNLPYKAGIRSQEGATDNRTNYLLFIAGDIEHRRIEGWALQHAFLPFLERPIGIAANVLKSLLDHKMDRSYFAWQLCPPD